MPEGGNLTLHSSNPELNGDPFHSSFVPGPFVLLAVSDTRCSINPQGRMHLFEPFFTTRSGRTGLGPASVYGIVGQSGSRVRSNTQLGIGASFHIYLPRN